MAFDHLHVHIPGIVSALVDRVSAVIWPVGRDSSRGEVKFQPLPKRQAVKIYHEARRLDTGAPDARTGL